MKSGFEAEIGSQLFDLRPSIPREIPQFSFTGADDLKRKMSLVLVIFRRDDFKRLVPGILLNRLRKRGL